MATRPKEAEAPASCWLFWLALAEGTEAMWRAMEEALELEACDQALRAETQRAVDLYAAAPALTDALYLDPAEEQFVRPDRVRTEARAIARAARTVRAALACLTPPGRFRASTLTRAIIASGFRGCAEEHADFNAETRRYLARWSVRLAHLSDAAAAVAETYDPPTHRNIARMELVARLTRAIEHRCGPGSATLGWDDVNDVGQGRLFTVVWWLRPWLPGLEDIMHRRLYDALLTARGRAR